MADLLWFVKGFYPFSKALESLSVVSTILLYKTSIRRGGKAKRRLAHFQDIPAPLAYAAAARISRSLSLTTSDVFGEESTSSNMSRNLRDVD